tara:strand:+ start:176428 stop:178296 length:1869 start_codon:yes stop_codon:yes gene_type:complete
MRLEVGGPGFDAIKPRIFQIGFNKCGTRSFYDFFEKNGIKSVHFKRGDLARGISDNLSTGKPPLEGWDKWTAYTDMQSVKKTGVVEACAFYRSFAAYYPRSYFILNTRSKDRWIQSRLNHGTAQNYGERYRQGLGLSSMDETVEAWSAMWDKHHAEVPAFFKETGQNFILYNIEQDTPDKLSDFLSRDFATDPSLFGHEGKTDAAPQTAKQERLIVGYDQILNVTTPSKKSTPSKRPEPSADAAVSDKLSKRFQPRNDLVGFDESAVQPPFDHVPPKEPIDGSTGNLIIATVKNDAPRLLEWIAYHRAIGFDHFLIFSSDCSDGTQEMLQHLQKRGFVTHLDYDEQTGESPSTSPLDKVMTNPKVFEADWIVHIDTDEFVNIRTGNGTFDCLVNELPENVTNIAMTRRNFGSAGLLKYQDAPVLSQFDTCAPSYLPKPHTAWGFKTATRNIGAYQSLTTHRPTNLSKEYVKEVIWVNGSGEDITTARAKSGWRSDVKTVGYDLVQLNRYPLRSLSDFLVTREAMAPEEKEKAEEHWVRMDWNSCKDVTIQRNLPRVMQALEQLKSDPDLSRLHDTAVQRQHETITEIEARADTAALISRLKAKALDDVSRVVEILDADSTAD